MSITQTPLQDLIGLMTDKDCLLKVLTDDNDIHISWVIGDEVLVFEHMPGNYPSSSISVNGTLDDYFNSIREVSWINEEDNIIRNHVEEEEHGVIFPFVIKEE